MTGGPYVNRFAGWHGVAPRGPSAYLGIMEKEPKPSVQSEGDTPHPPVKQPMPKEIGGPPGPEPTRYGDWEHKGRCSDF